MSHFGRRYIDAGAFRNDITRLRIYRTFVGEGLLERLEQTRLVIPKLRIRYPDPIARRWWHEAHSNFGRVFGDIEPDGPRYEAVMELADALHRRRNQRAYGRRPHPLDDLEPRFAEFVHRPAEREFVPLSDFHVDVSNETHAPFYDPGGTETFYSSWQLLLVAEVADMGVHYLVNLADPEIRRRVHESFVDGEAIPVQTGELYFAPAAVVRALVQHERALDALVWFTEEANNSLLFITVHQAGRYRRNEAESEQYRTERDEAARAAAARYAIGFDDILALCCFLAQRWSDWNGNGRPLIADEYKRYLGRAVLMARIIGERSYDEMRRLVGHQGGYFKPILDVVWPDWGEREKDRARRTLKGMIRDPNRPRLEAAEADIDAFVDFLDRENLHPVDPLRKRVGFPSAG